jgi:hypothetical protein
MGLLAAVVVGAALRLVWPCDIEYKLDEQWTFLQTQRVGHDLPFPWVGMPTSYEVRHPGGTVWIFLGLRWLTGATTPAALGQACAACNALALALLAVFVARCVSAAEREPWVWAVAVAAVNPLAVVLQRKIWPPSLAPIFCVGLLASWWHRHTVLGAVAWGVTGALVGQVHPAGLFLAAALVAWTVAFARPSVRWGWWTIGSVVGAVPLVPWLGYVWTTLAQQSIRQHGVGRVFEGKFWLRWVTEPFGLSVEYSLGADFGAYLQGPQWYGTPTYGLALVHVGLVVACGVTVLLVVARAWRHGSWQQLVQAHSATGLLHNGVLWGFGVAFTLTCLPMHRHYMPLTFPFMFLWLARAILGAQPTPRRRAALGIIVGLQLLATIGFLHYLHTTLRPIRGDYGSPLRLLPAEVRAGHAIIGRP